MTLSSIALSASVAGEISGGLEGRPSQRGINLREPVGAHVAAVSALHQRLKRGDRTGVVHVMTDCSSYQHG